MDNELTDADRAEIAAAWVGCAFGNGGARAIQAAAEATYRAGLAAGRLRGIEDPCPSLTRPYRSRGPNSVAAIQQASPAPM
jgi:hypothetical protein